jgi:hypothetical protein
MPRGSKSKSPRLTVIKHQTATQPVETGLPPPAHLGPVGRDLWSEIVEAYQFEDRASYETLGQACAAADRAAACARQIAEDGEVVRMKGGGVKDHPLLKHELANRSFVVRSLARLGLDLEPVRPMGRPPGPRFA